MNKPPLFSYFVIILLFSSCASDPQYTNLKNSGALTPHAGKGMVLVYRTPGFVGAADPGELISVDDHILGRLPRGGFYSYEAAPGPLNLGSSLGQRECRNDTRIDVLPNTTHYLVMDAHLDEVPNRTGEEQIQGCHWLNDPNSRRNKPVDMRGVGETRGLKVTVNNETGYDLSELKYVRETGGSKSQVGFARQVVNGGSHTFSLTQGGDYRVYASLVIGGKMVYAKSAPDSLDPHRQYELTLLRVITGSKGSSLNFINQSEFDAIK